MISFSFRKSDLLWPAVLLLFAAAGVAWNQVQGKPLSLTPFLGLGIAFASLLVEGYYRARLRAKELEYQARIEAQPLIELKVQLIHELTHGRRRVAELSERASNLEASASTAAKLASLDKAAVRSLLISIAQPTRKSLWIERSFGFVSGVAASLVASVLYELARR